MKKYCWFIYTLWGFTSLFAQKIEVNKNPLEFYIANTKVFQENQIPPHTPIAPFDSKLTNKINKWEDSPWVISLNGKWRFMWSKNPAIAPWDFHSEDFNDSQWDYITVPSCWQMEGYGNPKFRNVQQPFPSDPPHVPSDYNPVGSYRTNFNFSKDWNDRRILIYFEGVKTSMFLWINGNYIGYNEGGMEPAEFDITNFVKQGKNQIAVQVLRFADATYLECQDMWRLSGIFRPIYIMAMPRVHIQDYFIETDLDDQKINSDLEINFSIYNSDKTEKRGYSIVSTLFDPIGKEVKKEYINVERIKAQKNISVMLNTKIENPKKWSAEKPNRYLLVMELLNNQNKIIQSYSETIGFREIEIKNQALLVNGIPVKLNGVCSHVHHPLTGRTMDLETMRKDLVLMKQFNINCVRTSHYPMNREYYDLADRLGMYVIDETNDEAHATIYLSNDTTWKDIYLDRASKMVYRDRNHPSVIIWSAGNESGTGNNICELIELGKKIDPTRPAWLYGGNNDSYPRMEPMDCEDIVGPRYSTPFELKIDYALSNDPRPSFMDEYVAVTGNSGGMFDEFWEVIRKYPRTIGGAVWDWVSPSIITDWIETPDESKFSNNGSIMGRFNLVNGKYGKALAPSGHDTWVEVYRAPELDLDLNELTISFWIKPNKWKGLETFISKGDWQFGIRQPFPDSLEFYLTTETKTKLFISVPPKWENNWHHVMGVYDNNSMKLYIDEILEGNVKQHGKIINSPFPINLCRNRETDGENFTGNMSDDPIDRVAIFPRALTPDQVRVSGPNEASLWLDFEETAITDTFYSTGIGGRTYGLIWADRKPQPELYQLKKSAQPIEAKPINLEKGIIQIKNWHHFTNLSEVSTEWTISHNGNIVEQGTKNLELEPLKSKNIIIPFNNNKLTNPGIYYLTLTWKTKKDNEWAKSGHEIAFEQFELQIIKSSQQNVRKSSQKLSVKSSDTRLIISGNDFMYEFDKLNGRLSSIEYNKIEILRKGPLTNVWRAPLANDLDRWTFDRAKIIDPDPALSKFAANAFWSAGLDRLKEIVDDFNFIKIDEHVIIEINSHMIADGLKSYIENKYIYKIFPSGLIELIHNIEPQGKMPRYLPKMGLQMEINDEFKNWKWFGRGPFETYPDRKTGARFGVWETTVDDAYEPYLIPQDHANRTDIKWSTFANDQIGLFIQSEESINVSAQKWQTDNLSRSLYTPQLKPTDGITLNIDPLVSGVGCTAVSILNKYSVFPNEVEYKISLKPFKLNNTTPEILMQEFIVE